MIKLSIEPTSELLELQGVTFRIYRGTDAHGVQVRLLVAALAIEHGAELKDHEPLIENQSARPMALKDSEVVRLAQALQRTGLRAPTGAGSN
jgi:hypothetical protein